MVSRALLFEGSGVQDVGTRCNSHFAGRDSEMKVKGEIFLLVSHCEDLNLFLDTKYEAIHRVSNLCTFL